jgi:NAD+ kinase
MDVKLAFTASEAAAAQQALATLVDRYGNGKEAQADVIIALGGDGFMLQTLQRTQALAVPVYGMNRGTIGFLMNEFCVEDLPQRVLMLRKR